MLPKVRSKYIAAVLELWLFLKPGPGVLVLAIFCKSSFSPRGHSLFLHHAVRLAGPIFDDFSVCFTNIGASSSLKSF